ncbi:hypothetical protein AX17_002425 [Amanita inopinata Kibby_2008]|nr:hypothetical protein AX17_002425 [Amanita inopinata Kibby_2008]
MDFFLSPDELYDTDLPHAVSKSSDVILHRIVPLQIKAGGLENIDMKDYLSSQEPPSRFDRNCQPMQDIINRDFRFSAPSCSTFASDFNAQHQHLSLCTPSTMPLLSSYTMLSNENDFLYSSDSNSTIISSTCHQSHTRTRSFSSNATLLDSPFSNSFASPSALSTPVNYDLSRTLGCLSPVTHLPGHPLCFIRDMDTPFDIRGPSPSWASSDPDLSPVIRAHPNELVSHPQRVARSKDVKSSPSSSIDHNKHSLPSNLNQPVTPKRRLRPPFGAHPLGCLSEDVTSRDLASSLRTPEFRSHATLSPLTPLTPYPSSGSFTHKNHGMRKTRQSDIDLPSPSPLPRKRRRFSSDGHTNLDQCSSGSYHGSDVQDKNQSLTNSQLQAHYTTRSFINVDISPDFPLFYRRYPLSSYYQPSDAE